MWGGAQTVTSPGAVGAQTGTQVTNPWTAASIVFIPTSGQTITVGNVQHNACAGSCGTTATVTVPTGSAAGHLWLACVGYYTTGSAYNAIIPTGWTAVTPPTPITSSSIEAMQCFQHTATGSEPANYSFVLGGTGGFPTAFIADMGANVMAYDSQLTSATAAFTAADVGKLICVDGVGGGQTITNTGSNENCGTIGAYGNATTVYPTFPNGVATVSSKEFRYATNDTAAITSAIAALSNGGEVFFPQGMYGVNATISMPTGVPINLVGAAAQTTMFAGVAIGGGQQATSLLFLTQSLTKAGLSFVHALGGTVQGAYDTVSNLQLSAGAGQLNLDGGGADGIDIINWSHVTIDHCGVFGFLGTGIDIDAQTSGAQATDYTVNDRVENSYISLNGQDGIRLGFAASATQYIETTQIENNEIEYNKNAGININAGNGPFVDGVAITGNTIQWDNRGGANPGAEVSIGGSCEGCFITNNHLETNASNTDGILDAHSGQASMIGPVITGNF